MLPDRTTVFVVDDDQSARDAVAAVAQAMGVPARTFASAEAFFEEHNQEERGCLVCDVRLLGISGLQLLERLRASCDCLPVILITAYADVPLAVRAMQQGALTLLEKPCRSHELWEAIRKGLEFDAANRDRLSSQRASTRRLTSLTTEEQKIVRSIMRGKLNKSIAADLDLSVRTVESRRRLIFEKLGVRNVIELVQLVCEAQGSHAF